MFVLGVDLLLTCDVENGGKLSIRKYYFVIAIKNAFDNLLASSHFKCQLARVYLITCLSTVHKDLLLQHTMVTYIHAYTYVSIFCFAVLYFHRMQPV